LLWVGKGPSVRFRKKRASICEKEEKSEEREELGPQSLYRKKKRGGVVSILGKRAVSSYPRGVKLGRRKQKE